MSLCTRDDIKDRLGIASSDTDHDDVIDQIILGFAARANSFTGRILIVTAADVTEYYTGGCNRLRLKRYPVISITTVIESWDYGFDETALTANTDYRQLASGVEGYLFRMYNNWLTVPDGIQIIYRGGYCAAGVTPSGDEIALPDDLREAAILQCCFIFKRKDDIGLAGVSFAGGGFSKFEAVKLLPEVESILKSYRRITL
ncbi:MAG: hypothetical protein DRP56_04935 [Planctomycetota bacterium]|nr:MAG: hypothetical protein DRP56_04935 [Planctomycetota bacterium]